MHLHLYWVQLSLEKLYTCLYDGMAYKKVSPGEVKIFFVTGLMFPNEEEFSSAPVHGAVGSEGYSSPLGAALHLGIAGFFCFSAVPLH